MMARTAPRPRDDVRARTLAAAKGEASPTRVGVAQRSRLAAGAFVVMSSLMLVVTGGVHVGARPLGLVAMPVLAWTFVIALAYALAFRVRSMNGAPRVRLVILACALPVILWASFVAAKVGTGGIGGAVPPRMDLACALLTSTIASVALVTFAVVRGPTDAVHPRATGAFIGALSGALGAVWANLHCPECGVSHVMIAHLAPIVLFGALGSVVAPRLFGLRSR